MFTNLVFDLDQAVASAAVRQNEAVKRFADVFRVPNGHFGRVHAGAPQLFPLKQLERKMTAFSKLFAVMKQQDQWPSVVKFLAYCVQIWLNYADSHLSFVDWSLNAERKNKMMTWESRRNAWARRRSRTSAKSSAELMALCWSGKVSRFLTEPFLHSSTIPSLEPVETVECYLKENTVKSAAVVF